MTTPNPGDLFRPSRKAPSAPASVPPSTPSSTSPPTPTFDPGVTPSGPSTAAPPPVQPTRVAAAPKEYWADKVRRWLQNADWLPGTTPRPVQPPPPPSQPPPTTPPSSGQTPDPNDPPTVVDPAVGQVVEEPKKPWTNLLAAGGASFLLIILAANVSYLTLLRAGGKGTVLPAVLDSFLTYVLVGGLIILAIMLVAALMRRYKHRKDEDKKTKIDIRLRWLALFVVLGLTLLVMVLLSFGVTLVCLILAVGVVIWGAWAKAHSKTAYATYFCYAIALGLMTIFITPLVALIPSTDRAPVAVHQLTDDEKRVVAGSCGEGYAACAAADVGLAGDIAGDYKRDKKFCMGYNGVPNMAGAYQQCYREIWGTATAAKSVYQRDMALACDQAKAAAGLTPDRKNDPALLCDDSMNQFTGSSSMDPNTDPNGYK